MKLNRDLLNNAPTKDVVQAVYSLVDDLQMQRPHIQAAATAVLFLVVADLYRVQPQDVFTTVKNLLSDPIHGEAPELRALRLYAQHELNPNA